MRYILNSAVVTAYGSYRFEGPLSVDDARAFVRTGALSAVGHESAAELLTTVLKTQVAHNRVSITMQPGDQALVLRLLSRPPEGLVLDVAAMSGAAYEFGLLTRLE